jgi:3-hydroxybutyrate dehydrogenase
MLKGRCALVTGSTQGLGYAAAERLALAGCNIVMNGLGDREEIEAKRRRLEGHGVRAVHSDADLARRDEEERLVETAQRQFGGIDILVNNAVVRHFAPVEKFSPADWEEAMAVAIMRELAHRLELNNQKLRAALEEVKRLKPPAAAGT